MEIKASELRKGVEVDLPVEWDKKPVRQCTIKYIPGMNRYVMADIKTKEIHYSYRWLSDLVRITNEIYNYKDIGVDD